MAERNNFLLGNGEKLTTPVEVPTGGGAKRAPYSFEAAVRHLQPRLRRIADAVTALPEAACPDDVAVAVLTMHPRYISKSDFPTRFLQSTGLVPLGSRARRIKPREWGIKNPPEDAVTDQLFVGATRETFRRLPTLLTRRIADPNLREELTHIEDLEPFEAETKIKGIDESDDNKDVTLEVGVHTGIARSVERFLGYAESLGARPVVDRVLRFDELAFVPVRTTGRIARELARFSLVRVARRMPGLRPFRPAVLRTSNEPVALPTEGPLDSTTRAVIFDGGLPPTPDLSHWVRVIEPDGIGPPDPESLEHGLAVTAALLFGTLSSRQPAQRPFCPVDHVRVLDKNLDDSDLLSLDVLARIEAYLDQHPDEYDFINISMGPLMPIDDDEPTPWTLALDKRLAGGRALCCVAVGNSGDSTPPDNRIQPPSDAVNVCAVGSANAVSPTWSRSAHSCVGPGRAPGVVKPDIVTFGGCDDCNVLFPVLTPAGVIGFECGTSLASPFALRTGVGIRALAGPSLTPLAVRALLIHSADPADHSRLDVGWGRVPTDPAELITCADNEVCVVYQGALPVGEHLRAQLPVPAGPLKGKIEIEATLLISPEVDPARPSAYTKAGLEVAFRPHSKKFRTNKSGRQSRHPVTMPFFTEQNMYGAAEYQFRDDGSKWEPARRHRHTFRASQLDMPVFDIYYHHRDGGAKALAPPGPIPYALVVSLRAAEMPDLYDRVVRTYSQVLVPLQPQIEINVGVIAGSEGPPT